jgi:hypothetical protein
MNDMLLRMPAEALRQTWQCRALAQSKERTFAVLLAAMVAEYHVGVKLLLKAAHPGFVDIELPMIVGYGSIMPDGTIWAWLCDKDRNKKAICVYENAEKLRYEFRKLADAIKISDSDRLHMFGLIQKWVTMDGRVDEQGRRRLVH